MASEVPLLNEYKQTFFWKRFPQTLLGGPKLKLGYSAPAYVYVNQVILFLVPVLVGGIFTLVVELSSLQAHIAYYIVGACVALYACAVQLISFVVQRRTDAVAAFQNTNVLAEEDEVEFDSCCGHETLQFTVPTKRFKLNILLHALLSGPLCGLGFWYLLPSTLHTLYGNVGATVIIYAFGWLTLCIAQYPLTVGSPPEPALYRAIDTMELLPLLRPMYAFICLFVHVAWSVHPSSLLLANQILHVAFILLPVLWCTGVLPPFDALCFWLMEQTVVHFLGGSPMAGDLRCCLMFMASMVVALVACFLPSSLAVIVFSACLGYILSLDLSSLANQIAAAVQGSCSKPRSRTPSPQRRSPPDPSTGGGNEGESKGLGLGWRWGWKEVSLNMTMLLLVGAVAGITAHLQASTSSSVVRILGYVILGLTVTVKIAGNCQKVFVVFGMLRNKLFPDSISNTGIYSRRKKGLNRLGVIRRCLLGLVCPFLMEAYVGLILTDTGLKLPSFWFSVGAVYSLRKVWQHKTSSLVDVCILHIVRELSVHGSGSLVTWWPSATGLQLILIGLLHSWVEQSLDKVYCYLTLLVTSYSLEKQRRKSSLPVLVTMLVLFPLILGVIGVSSLLSAPLLPLFTLPLVWVGFPRPLRAWPGAVGAAANTCADSVYYQQLEGKLRGVLRRAVAAGSLGDLSPGSYLLIRFQDRMVWLHVLERGHGFVTMSLKGMELQETSCHTVEAARLDDIFDSAFIHAKEKFPLCALNQYPMHTLTPLDAQMVDTYSDARNVLTGIIDSPDTLDLVDACFIQTLVWLLLRHNSDKRKHLPSPSSSSSASHQPGVQGSGSVGSRSELVPNRQKENPRGMSVSEDSGRPESMQSKPPSGHIKHQQVKRKSVVGSWHSLDSWNDDNDSMELEPIKRNKLKPGIQTKDNLMGDTLKGAANLPGTVPDLSDDDLDDIMNELEFGLPAVDVRVAKKASQKGAVPVTRQPLNLNTSAQFSSPYSSKLSLPLKWREIPMDTHQISPLLARFPMDWYKHVIAHLGIESAKPPSDVAIEVASDEALTSMYANLVMACYGVVDVFGLEGLSVAGAGSSHVFKVYSGDIPWSMSSDWLTSDEELLAIVLKAYRFAFKLAYDQTVLGEASDLDEVQEYLEEYETEWYIGRDTDQEWSQAVQLSKPRLFSLSYDTNDNTYHGRVLTRQPMMVHIGRLNPEVVRSLWASLSLELLYFTNDDEERYSIQAHPVILRNLTIQAADPPLGYPIYASLPLSIPVW